jgi:hypothetical protein
MRAWQLDKIRRALLSYCAYKSDNGQSYSVRQILDDIPAGHGPIVELEAFRRFYKKETKSFKEPETLDDIIAFLYEIEFLTPADLFEDKATFAEAVTVHNAIANLSKQATRAHLSLAGHYTALLKAGEEESLSINLVIEPPGTLLWIEEEYSRHAKPGSPLKDDGVLHVIRKGYGISVSDVPTLNFFVRGADRMDLVHYVHIHEEQRLEGRLIFRRFGLFGEGEGRSFPEAVTFLPADEATFAPVAPRLTAAPALELDFASMMSITKAA